ncbi:unnamed protein product [Notodromas monacha]|uniref:Small ribosomal subunit protein mS23 n=1 Tax=Notodromas monacha TaxID=399045 RepID=A0A7R9BUE0_9CRUS|nr:unnamed protein product [Notodromas monacha]CAG0920312.1 unnamed protein product [Notodromas monacha]
MASSRLEKIGTIFTRAAGLIKSGAMKESEKPLWFEIYRNFPPRFEPRVDRQVPVAKESLRQIFYEEDIIRAKFYKRFRHVPAIHLNDARPGLTLSERFLSKYYEVTQRSENKGLGEDEVFDATIAAINSEEGIDLSKFETPRPRGGRPQQSESTSLRSEFAAASSSNQQNKMTTERRDEMRKWKAEAVACESRLKIGNKLMERVEENLDRETSMEMGSKRIECVEENLPIVEPEMPSEIAEKQLETDESLEPAEEVEIIKNVGPESDDASVASTIRRHSEMFSNAAENAIALKLASNPKRGHVAASLMGFESIPCVPSKDTSPKSISVSGIPEMFPVIPDHVSISSDKSPHFQDSEKINQMPEEHSGTALDFLHRKLLTDSINGVLGIEEPLRPERNSRKNSVGKTEANKNLSTEILPETSRFLQIHDLVDHIDMAMDIDKSIPMPQKLKPVTPPYVKPPSPFRTAMTDHVTGLIKNGGGSRAYQDINGNMNGSLASQNTSSSTNPDVSRIRAPASPRSALKVNLSSMQPLVNHRKAFQEILSSLTIPSAETPVDCNLSDGETDASAIVGHSERLSAAEQVTDSEPCPNQPLIYFDEEPVRESAAGKHRPNGQVVEMSQSTCDDSVKRMRDDFFAEMARKHAHQLEKLKILQQTEMEELWMRFGLQQSSSIQDRQNSSVATQRTCPSSAEGNCRVSQTPDASVVNDDSEFRKASSVITSARTDASLKDDRSGISEKISDARDNEYEHRMAEIHESRTPGSVWKQCIADEPGLSKIPGTRSSFASTLDGLTMEDSLATPVPPHEEPVSFIYVPEEALDPKSQKVWCKVSAHAKGFLTRRLLRTEKTINLIRCILDTAKVAYELGDSEEEAWLRKRFVAQISAWKVPQWMTSQTGELALEKPYPEIASDLGPNPDTTNQSITIFEASSRTVSINDWKNLTKIWNDGGIFTVEIKLEQCKNLGINAQEHQGRQETIAFTILSSYLSSEEYIGASKPGVTHFEEETWITQHFIIITLNNGSETIYVNALKFSANNYDFQQLQSQFYDCGSFLDSSVVLGYNVGPPGVSQ